MEMAMSLKLENGMIGNGNGSFEYGMGQKITIVLVDN